MKFCGEIQYMPSGTSVHSDVCHDCAGEGSPVSDEKRAFYHALLDEWLNKSGGTGAFWLGDPEFMNQNFNMS